MRLHLRVYYVLFLFVLLVLAVTPSLTHCLEEESIKLDFEIGELNEGIQLDEEKWTIDSSNHHHHHHHGRAPPPHSHRAQPPRLHSHHHAHPPRHHHHAPPPQGL
ncbi:hypothetical protein ACP275_07G033100 [Erythranthe tilingii]